MACLTEVPRRPFTAARLKCGLRPYGLTCSLPPGCTQGLGAALVYPTSWDLRAVSSAADGRLIHGDVDLPGVEGLIPVTIAAAYCPQGGTTTNRSRAWLAQERALAAAGLALIDRCRRLGRVLLLGMDANAIASSLDTWSVHARPREESCLARWMDAGLLDTFRIHFPLWRVATHFAAIGGAPRASTTY